MLSVFILSVSIAEVPLSKAPVAQLLPGHCRMWQPKTYRINTVSKISPAHYCPSSTSLQYLPTSHFKH